VENRIEKHITANHQQIISLKECNAFSFDPRHTMQYIPVVAV
jgi:hypothetical protein